MWRTFWRLASAALGIGVIVLVVLHVDWTEVGKALRHASLPLVLAAAALNFVNLAAKSARWQVMLRPIGRVAFWRLYYYLIVSYAASALLPARAGEALRVLLLRRRDHVAVADSVGVVVVEKLFEVLGLLVVVAPLPLLLVLPRWAEVSIWTIAAGGLVALLVAVILAARLGAREAEGSWHKLARGLTCMKSPSRIGLSVALSVAAYLIDAAEVWLVWCALGIDVPWATPALVLLGGNLAIAVPSTPGQWGALEAGVIAGLSIAHVPVPAALAFALVYHVMQLLPIVLVGLSGLRLVAEARTEAPGSPPPLEVVS
jgi:uncharacterized membrane protein YbhN (UPF0104 family)